MMKSVNFKYYIFSSAVLLAAGCKVPAVLSDTAGKELPREFVIPASDTLNIQQLTIDDFFADQYLKQLIRKTLRDNPDYRIAFKRISIAEAYLVKSRGALWPSLKGLGNASATQYGKYTMEGVGNFDTNLSPNIEESQKIGTHPTPNYFLGFGADWELDIWGKYRHTKRAAKARFWATVEGKKLLESMLVTQTALVYYDLIALDQEISILHNNIRLQEEAFEVVQIHQEVGRSTLLAVKQMEAQLNNSRSLLYLKQQELQEAETAMQELIGEYEGSVVRSNSIDIQAVRYLYNNAVPVQVMAYRPDIRQALHELEATHADAKAARAAFFPSVNITAYLAYNAFSGEMLFNPASLGWQVLGGITAPILNKNQIRSDFKIATAQQEIAFIELERATMKAYREVNLLLRKISNTNLAYAEKEKESRAITSGVEISQDLYMNGYANYLELIAARKSKLEADLQIIELKRMQVQQLVQLYKVLGGGYDVQQ